MAALCISRKCLVRPPASSFVLRCVMSTEAAPTTKRPARVPRNKPHVAAGRIQSTKRHDCPLTYEEAKPPYLIGVEKAWSTWNTSNLKDEGRKSETLVEDVFIRQFMDGTWYQMLASDVVIKRRHNIVVISAIVKGFHKLQYVYFLQGYTEELLAHYLKCPVKVEIQSVNSNKDMVFKYI